MAPPSVEFVFNLCLSLTSAGLGLFQTLGGDLSNHCNEFSPVTKMVTKVAKDLKPAFGWELLRQDAVCRQSKFPRLDHA